MATAVCHAQPRSSAAWQQLADVELQLSDPSVYSFLRANFIAAMLDDEEEWWNAGKKPTSKSSSIKTSNARDEKKTGTPTSAEARARVWLHDGEYDKAKKHVKKALQDHKGAWQNTEAFHAQIDRQLKMARPTLERLIPLVAQWK